jgi:hypothetical protein
MVFSSVPFASGQEVILRRIGDVMIILRPAAAAAAHGPFRPPTGVSL